MMTFHVSDTDCLDAALIMFRNTPETKNCSFLFVEGDSDEKFWNGRISEECCIVFVVSFSKNNVRQTGKTAVIKNVRHLNESGVVGFLGIVDSDFDALLYLPRENNIHVTDMHDLETLLLNFSTVFRKLLVEFGDNELVVNFENDKTIQSYLIELALPFAQIEWLKQHLQPDLELKNLHLNETIFIRDKWHLNQTKLHTFAQEKGVDTTLLLSRQLLMKLDGISPLLLCNGHSMIDILSIGFQNGILGNNKRVTSDAIASYIRGAIDKNELYQTELCQSVFNWQKINAPYIVLP
jgi:hypothetical protein